MQEEPQRAVLSNKNFGSLLHGLFDQWIMNHDYMNDFHSHQAPLTCLRNKSCSKASTRTCLRRKHSPEKSTAACLDPKWRLTLSSLIALGWVVEVPGPAPTNHQSVSARRKALLQPRLGQGSHHLALHLQAQGNILVPRQCCRQQGLVPPGQPSGSSR